MKQVLFKRREDETDIEFLSRFFSRKEGFITLSNSSMSERVTLKFPSDIKDWIVLTLTIEGICTKEFYLSNSPKSFKDSRKITAVIGDEIPLYPETIESDSFLDKLENVFSSKSTVPKKGINDISNVNLVEALGDSSLKLESVDKLLNASSSSGKGVNFDIFDV
jgi:hypothetical protein